MTRWIIGTVAEGVAADMSAARASSWMQEGANNDVRGYLHAAIVKQQILTDIQTLAEAGHIHPRHPGSGHASEMGSPVDATHYLTRSDLEKVLHFVRRDVHSKQDFLRELDEWRASGRYMLAQAADLLEAEAGERYDQILRRLKQAVRDNELNMYEPGRNQKLQYAAPRQAAAVRDFYEEAYWNDLNAWLSVHEPRISWRFPHPPGSATSVPVTESAASESVKLRSDEPEATKIEDRSASELVQERRDLLDPPIDKAIASARGQDFAAVYPYLKQLALDEEPPFTGIVEDGGALAYTDSNNRKRSLTKDALAKRLKRRAEPAASHR